ncbi:uncharacterized protein LOC141824739 isoform X2 [Curcuma longa]|uniref:uncharacterized protein LOC141824739 isoform X2 n=1 Tax=Curcuma longa TaxID=136217 RepID=UPI003D9FAFF2
MITKYLPNEFCGGMIAFSLALANAALLFVLQGGYHWNLENSTIIALVVFGLLIATGCIYKLGSWRKMSVKIGIIYCSHLFKPRTYQADSGT